MTCRLDIEGFVPSHTAHLVLGILSENVPTKLFWKSDKSKKYRLIVSIIVNH
jgi:hypothetical protein